MSDAKPTPNLARRLLTRAMPPLLVLALAVFIAGELMSSSPRPDRRPAPERQARLVETVVAEPATERVRITAWGETRATRAVALTPQVGGRVRTVHPELEPGGILAAGTVALEIDPRDFELQLEQARSELTRAQAELALEQGQQAVAKREYELLQRSVSEQERRLVLRAPQLETAEAAVAAARAAVAEAELALARSRLEVPFDALVLERTAAPGAQISSSTEVATLAGLDRWWVEVAVPVSALPWIEVAGIEVAGEGGGAGVRLRDTAWPAEQYREGRVVRRYGVVEEQGRMARLLVAVDDPLAREAAKGEPPLLLGSFLQARILGRSLEDVYALDPAWLREGEQVWIMDPDGRLEMRRVDIAWRGDKQVLVRSGLVPGERIVTTPINGAAEGMPLRTAASDQTTTGEADAL